MKQHRNNVQTIEQRKSEVSAWRLARLGIVVMTLVLSLCFVGCALYRSPKWIEPAVNVGPQGNAVIATLPMGTVICVPDKEAGEKIGMAFVNELAPAQTDWVGGKAFRCKVPVKICTGAYIAERDQREIRNLTGPGSTADNAESTDGKKAGPNLTEAREGNEALDRGSLGEGKTK